MGDVLDFSYGIAIASLPSLVAYAEKRRLRTEHGCPPSGLAIYLGGIWAAAACYILAALIYQRLVSGWSSPDPDLNILNLHSFFGPVICP